MVNVIYEDRFKVIFSKIKDKLFKERTIKIISTNNYPRTRYPYQDYSVF